MTSIHSCDEMSRGPGSRGRSGVADVLLNDTRWKRRRPSLLRPDIEYDRDACAISDKTLETPVLTTCCLKVGEMCGESFIPSTRCRPLNSGEDADPNTSIGGTRQAHRHERALVEDGAHHLQTHVRAGRGPSCPDQPHDSQQGDQTSPVWPQVRTL